VNPDAEQHSEPCHRFNTRRFLSAVVAFCIFNLASASFSADGTAHTIADDEAAIIAGQFKTISDQLKLLAADTELIRLFSDADTTTLAQEAEHWVTGFTSALKLRLLLPGLYEVDNSAHPPLGFASLELLRRAETSNVTINPEAVLIGTENAHIVFVERVRDTAGKLVGLIHLSVNVNQFDQALAKLSSASAYVELQQTAGARTLVMARKGPADSKAGEPLLAVIPGTGWNLAYWKGSTLSMISSEGPDGLGATTYIIGVFLLLAIVAGVLFLRRTRATPETDTSGTVDTGVIYTGAIRAIMEGAHPGMEKLIPNLATLKSDQVNVQPISQGMTGDDITMIISSKQLQSAAAEAAAPGEAEVPAAPGSEDFFDLTGGEESTSEPVKEPKKTKPAKVTTAAARPDKPEISPTIFRAYDIRGIVGKELTPETVHKIGQAIGSEAAKRNENTVAVGRDGRNSSLDLATALIAGLRAAGCNVIDIGMVPTPVLYFATHTLDTHSGVMVTGSHNGPEYNGLKIVLAGETLSQFAIQDIYRRVVENNLASGAGELDTREVSADYLHRITDDIPVALGRAYKLVVDCGNGVAGKLAPQLYRALGHNIIELYCDIDGKFPNHHPDPSQPENLQDLIDKVKAEKADLGFAFDGDGDRLGVVDGMGRIIWPDRQLMILAQDVLSRNAGAPIIYDVKCSRHLKKVITAAGGQPLMWKTGHSLIKQKMKEVQAPLAGEMSGHIFFKERWYGFDDALYTSARLLEVLMKSKDKPAVTLAKIPDAVSTPELRVDLQESAHDSFMGELQGRINFSNAEVFDVDGFRVEFPDGWGLVRPSNTTPCLVLRFEADNQEALDRIKAKFHDLLLSVKPDLTLPF